MIRLYPEQEVVLDEVRSHLRRGVKRIVMVAPCGFGKNVVSAYMAKSANARRLPVLFLVNRREIVKDFSRRLDRAGVDHGVIMANHPRRRPDLLTQVASIDTIHRRDKVPPASLIIADECHFATSTIWAETFARYDGRPIVGMTATPLGPGGTGLKGTFDVMVQGPTTQTMIDAGRLVPVKAFGPKIDKGGLKANRSGEYNEAAAAQVLDKRKLIGDMVDHWLRIASDRVTACFAQSVGHSKHIQELFTAAGVPGVVHVDAKTPSDVRDAVWEDMAKGKVRLCTNVGVTSYGWDVPRVSCIIGGRFTDSVVTFRQMVGRGQRTSPENGKVDCLLLDHACWYDTHGFIEDDPEWDLEGPKKKASAPVAKSVRKCASCWASCRPTWPKCPYCGYEFPAAEAYIPPSTDGELVLLSGNDRKKKPAPYKCKNLSANPALAYFQQRCEAAGYQAKWFWAQFQLFKEGKVHVPQDVYEDWLAYEAAKEFNAPAELAEAV